MAINLIPFIYTAIFALIVVALVPRQEIRRLSIYGIIFGGGFDAIIVGIANLIGEFRDINYEPFGMMGIHFFGACFMDVVLYYLFLPFTYEKSIYLYLYNHGDIL